MLQKLCLVLAPDLSDKCVPVEKKVMASVWTLATPESFRSVGDRFDMAKSTLHAVFMDVCKALSAVRQQFIKMPETLAEYHAVSLGFSRKTGFPGVIGAVDGTHIPIHGPVESRASYINRKGNQLKTWILQLCTSDRHELICPSLLFTNSIVKLCH